MRFLKSSYLLASSILLVTSVAVANADDGSGLAPNKGKKPVTDAQQFAYSIGYLNGQGGIEQIPDLDIETFIRGYRDGYGRKQSLLSEEERATAVNRYKQQRLALLEAEMEKLGRANAAIGVEFLARNAEADGIKVTASGLQYREVTVGKGAKPKSKDIVKVNYEGSFLDGNVFDSSYSRNEPAVFQLDSVIPGWTEGLQLMNVGSTYEFFVPSELAYGEAGAGPIPPNSTLQFRVELLSIEKPTKKK
jgi:FKBP-type peptidyl-prolyl cis-trans isomerase FklB